MNVTGHSDGTRVIDCEIVVVGAGLAGTAAATVLARAGRSVTLIDSHSVFPPEFRAEKFGDPHIALFNRLGLGDIATGATTPIDSIDIYRFGDLVARHRGREYGYAYSDVINELRAALPVSVDMVVGRVAEIDSGPGLQSVVLADGRRIVSRLIVVATGLGDTIRRKVGIERIETRKAHSLSLGFDLDRPAASYAFESLAYYGSGYDRVAYLTLFPIRETMRANLFVYREANDPWTRSVRQDPAQALATLMPGLNRICDGFGFAGRVQVRPIDLTRSQGHRRDGVVLVGDAYCTTCPAPGVGVKRVLTDVERLCNIHIPAWLATPGMPAAKIDAFYDDPVKTSTDAAAIRQSEFSRSMAIDPGPVWAARRVRNAMVRKDAALIRRAGVAIAGSIDAAPMTGKPARP